MMRPGFNNVDVEALSDEAKFYGLIKRQIHTQRRRRIVDRKLSELLRLFAAGQLRKLKIRLQYPVHYPTKSKFLYSATTVLINQINRIRRNRK